MHGGAGIQWLGVNWLVLVAGDGADNWEIAGADVETTGDGANTWHWCWCRDGWG